MAHTQQARERTGGNLLPLVVGGIGLLIAVVALIVAWGDEKIGVVRTADLVAKYKGMEDARKAFEAQQGGWRSEIDTLEADYRKTVTTLNEEWSTLPASEREKRSELAQAQEQNLIRYSQTLEARVHEEETRLIEGVLNQVNDAVKEYAEEHGFDVIYGATPEGSILYGTDQLDITDELLETLNAQYQGDSGGQNE